MSKQSCLFRQIAFHASRLLLFYYSGPKSHRLIMDIFDLAAKESICSFLDGDVCDGGVKERPVLQSQVSKLRVRWCGVVVVLDVASLPPLLFNFQRWRTCKEEENHKWTYKYARKSYYMHSSVIYKFAADDAEVFLCSSTTCTICILFCLAKQSFFKYSSVFETHRCPPGLKKITPKGCLIFRLDERLKVFPISAVNKLGLSNKSMCTSPHSTTHIMEHRPS